MKKGKKQCPKCGRYFSPQGLPGHVEACEGRKRAKKKAVKKAAKILHCGYAGCDFKTTHGPALASHEKKCTGRPKKAVKKAKRKKAKKKDRFIIFDRDQEWLSEASSLQRAEDLASEMLENDVRADDISVFKVVAEYKVEKIKKAVLTLKAKK